MAQIDPHLTRIAQNASDVRRVISDIQSSYRYADESTKWAIEQGAGFGEVTLGAMRAREAAEDALKAAQELNARLEHLAGAFYRLHQM